MDTIYSILGIAATVVSGILVVLMLLTYRKQTPVGPFAPLLSILLSLVMLLVVVHLSEAGLNALCAGPVLVSGLFLGLVQGLSTKLAYKDGRVMRQRSRLFLVGWFGSLVLTQLLNVVGSTLAISLSLMPLYASTGAQLGLNGSIFVRRLRLQPPAPARPRMRLTVAQGQASPTTVDLAHAALNIGRGPDNDLVLNDALVSRSHAAIRVQGEFPVLHDLGSTNGTFVNGERIAAPQRLVPGDAVRMGDTVLIYEAVDGAT